MVYFDTFSLFSIFFQVKWVFETTKDVKRILQNLMMVNGSPILPEKTLVIFDEIQECNKALNTLKYFCEKAPKYHIACAGSLPGIAFQKGTFPPFADCPQLRGCVPSQLMPSSFPVGKVDFMTIYPMSFTEFLIANGDENLANYLESIDAIEPIPEIFFNQLQEKLKMYFITGGMPEAVRSWTEERNTGLVQTALIF